MKKVLTFISVMVVCVGLASSAWAQAPWPTLPGNSGVQVVNLTTGSGTVQALYIAEDGTQYTLPPQIASVP